jgi:hypothetical protein
VSLGTVIGLIVSVVALLATVILGLLRFRHEQKLADQADARATLAEGALALGHTKTTLDRAQDAFGSAMTTGQHWPEDEEAELRAIDDQVGELERAQAAVRIRFKGDHAAVDALDLAINTAQGIRMQFNLLGLRERPQGDQPPDSYQETTGDVLSLYRQFDRCRDRYLTAAQEAVGVTLG